MLASVLNTAMAVRVSVHVVEAFVRLTRAGIEDPLLIRRIDELERKVQTHESDLQEVFTALRELLLPPSKPRRRIGFVPRPEK